MRPIKKEMNGNLKSVLVFAGFLTLLWLIRNTYGVREDRKSCRVEKELSVSSVIIALREVPGNPKLKTIVLANGQSLEYTYSFGLWIQAEVGDSIVKRKGDTRYLIFHHSYSEADTFQFRDCDAIGRTWD